MCGRGGSTARPAAHQIFHQPTSASHRHAPPSHHMFFHPSAYFMHPSIASHHHAPPSYCIFFPIHQVISSIHPSFHQISCDYHLISSLMCQSSTWHSIFPKSIKNSVVLFPPVFLRSTPSGDLRGWCQLLPEFLLGKKRAFRQRANTHPLTDYKLPTCIKWCKISINSMSFEVRANMANC